MSFMTFPFVFVSSAYVPVESMPGWLQPVAEHQPVTTMVGAVRALTLGDEAEAVLGHSAAWFSVRALLWAVVIVVGVRHPGRPAASPGRDPELVTEGQDDGRRWRRQPRWS